MTQAKQSETYQAGSIVQRMSVANIINFFDYRVVLTRNVTKVRLSTVVIYGHRAFIILASYVYQLHLSLLLRFKISIKRSRINWQVAMACRRA